MIACIHRQLALHSGINFSRLEVGGDLGGCLFAAGSVFVLVSGLPLVRWFFFGAVAAAVPVACLLAAWRRHHHGPPRLWGPIHLDLTKGHPNLRA